jgi:DNA helicase-2/ATP-dependent DNA helicase PcrA
MVFVPNDAQKKAIEHVHGPMLVVAGAGTGKTTVLSHRIAHLIDKGHARADEILAITYTRNSADDLRKRIATAAGEKAGRALRAGTFHSFCGDILELSGRGFTPLENEDLYVYLRRRLPELKLEYYTRAVNPAEFLKALNDFFSRCHDELVTAAEYRAYVARLHGGKMPIPRVVQSGKLSAVTDDEALARCEEIARVYEQVEGMLDANGLGTFGHQPLRAVECLKRDHGVLERMRQRARFILIDEFQDANYAQIELVSVLAGDAANVFAVGDPDQAIYRFRGASNAAFQQFSKRYPRAAGVVLKDNQRSRAPILECGFATISENKVPECYVGGVGYAREKLESARERRGERRPAEKVRVVMCSGGDAEGAHLAEAQMVARAIGELSALPASGSGKPRFGVLYRSHSHREEALAALADFPAGVQVRGVDVLETGSVRDALACLRVIANPADTESLFRVAALDHFGVDGEAVRDALDPRESSISSALRSVPGGRAVLTTIEEARAAAWSVKMEAEAVVRDVCGRFGLPRDQAIEGFESFVGEWKKKPAAIVGDGTLASLMDYLDWFIEGGGGVCVNYGEDDADLEAPRLMTVHSAKGLEFDHVFLLRLNSSSFPTSYRERLFEFPDALRKSAAAAGDGKEVHREEERRLFYVGMTRARDTLTICTRPGRSKTKVPTAFAGELLASKGAKPFLEEEAVKAEPPRVDLMAAASAGLQAWLLAPPRPVLMTAPLSATTIEMYEKCPLRFKLSRDWNIPGAPAASLQYGTAVHTVLKDYYDALAQGRPRTIEDSLTLFRNELAGAYFDDEHQRDLYRRQGEEQLTNFLTARAEEPAPEVLKTEWSFALNLGGVRVQGRVDRIDRVASGLCVIDYKTGRARQPKDAEESLQLSLYALAVAEKFPERLGSLAILNLEDGTRVETARTQAQLDAAIVRVTSVAEGITAGNFEPRPDHMRCRYCDFRNLCPATEQRLYAISAAAAQPKS